MRVLAGRAKGRDLKVPRGQEVRPTPAKVRAALFNVLGDRILGASLLELFAGTGSVGIEALSRGAARVVFVERSARAASLIWENASRCGLLDGSELLREDVFGALRRLQERGDGFDLVFLDPPYEKGLVEKTLSHLVQCPRMLEVSAEVIVQHSPREVPPPVYGPLQRKALKSYGDSQLSFYSTQRHER